METKSAARKEGLHQFRLEFDAAEDRVLFRLATADRSEYLIWFTRRYVKMLRKQLEAAADTHPDVARHASREARESVSAFRRAAAVQKTDFSKTYEVAEAGDVSRPLGDAPTLATRLRVTANPRGMKILHFAPINGQEISVALNDDLLHSFLYMLADIVTKAGWDLDAAGPPESPAPAPKRLH